MSAVNVKELLKNIKNPHNPSEDLHHHLTNVISKLLLDNPKNAFEVFDDYSLRVKQSGFSLESLGDDKKANRFCDKYEDIKDGCAKISAFIGKINVGTPEEPAEPGPAGYVPNTMEEMKLFEQVGVYFGEELTYILHKSLVRLALDKQAKKVRFWGKIMGSKRDYYIAEGIQEGGEPDAAELPPNAEPKGSGVNRLNYWVTNDPLEPWVELPAILPKHIMQARRIKHILTGDLEATVITNPQFGSQDKQFGNQEKFLLKAQIVRISHATTLVPRGLYKLKEDEPREIEDEEEEKMRLPNPDELQSLDAWLHHTPGILKEGRIVHFEPEVPEDVEKEVFMKKIVDRDPFDARLKPISKDTPLEGYQKAWSIRVAGDPQYYASRDKKAAYNYSVIAIRSLVWPGAMTLYNNKNWTSIYVGYGFKGTTKLYAFENPQPIQHDAPDKAEFDVVFAAPKEVPGQQQDGGDQGDGQPMDDQGAGMPDDQGDQADPADDQ